MTENSAPVASVKKTDWLSIIVAFLTLAWVVGVTAFVQVIAWGLSASPAEFLQRVDVGAPFIFFNAALVQAIALLVPLVPLTVWWRAPRYRAAFRAWLAAAIFLILLAPARLVPSPSPQLAMVIQFALMLIFSITLWWLTGRGKFLERSSATAVALCVAMGILFALPWLLWGALGSIGDVVFGILNALAFALAATLIVTRVWLRGIARRGMAHDSRGAGWDRSDRAGLPQILRGRFVTLGGFVIGALLLVMGSAVGFSGTQVLFMVALSAFGWLLMDVTQINFRETIGWNDVAWFILIALAVAAPLLFLDPDTGVLLASAGDGEVLGYAANATGLVILGAWVLGLLFFILRTVVWRIFADSRICSYFLTNACSRLPMKLLKNNLKSAGLQNSPDYSLLYNSR